MSIILATTANLGGIVLSPSDSSVTGTNSGTAYAGIEIRNDGSEYSTDTDGGAAYDLSRGNWLDAGEANQVWVQWTRTGGTLGDWNDTDAGDTRLQLSATRNWRIIRTTSGTSTIVGYFEYYDAASGGNLLHTTASLTFTADNII